MKAMASSSGQRTLLKQVTGDNTISYLEMFLMLEMTTIEGEEQALQADPHLSCLSLCHTQPKGDDTLTVGVGSLSQNLELGKVNQQHLHPPTGAVALSVKQLELYMHPRAITFGLAST